jgi:hypothetical protein
MTPNHALALPCPPVGAHFQAASRRETTPVPTPRSRSPSATPRGHPQMVSADSWRRERASSFSICCSALPALPRWSTGTAIVLSASSHSEGLSTGIEAVYRRGCRGHSRGRTSKRRSAATTQPGSPKRPSASPRPPTGGRDDATDCGCPRDRPRRRFGHWARPSVRETLRPPGLGRTSITRSASASPTPDCSALQRTKAQSQVECTAGISAVP